MEKIIERVCEEIKAMLIMKNRSYGNSAAEPVNIFSRTNPLEQIRIRIDDKLKRIRDGHEYGTDDTKLDLIGYLILERCVGMTPRVEKLDGLPSVQEKIDSFRVYEQPGNSCSEEFEKAENELDQEMADKCIRKTIRRKGGVEW